MNHSIKTKLCCLVLLSSGPIQPHHQSWHWCAKSKVCLRDRPNIQNSRSTERLSLPALPRDLEINAEALPVSLQPLGQPSMPSLPESWTNRRMIPPSLATSTESSQLTGRGYVELSTAPAPPYLHGVHGTQSQQIAGGVCPSLVSQSLSKIQRRSFPTNAPIRICHIMPQHIEMSPAYAGPVEGTVPWIHTQNAPTLIPTKQPPVTSALPPEVTRTSAIPVEDNNVCVICLDAPSIVGLTHNDSTHLCLCLECSKLFKKGDKCPKCRAKIEIITRVYWEFNIFYHLW